MSFTFKVVTHLSGKLEDEGNIDIEIQVSNGDVYALTFFSVDDLLTQFRKNKVTGECRNGTYFWATDMIIVETLSEEVIQQTIQSLIEEDELKDIGSKLN